MSHTLLVFPVCLLLAAVSLSADWRQWRGPTNNGVAATAAPEKFSSDEGVKWRIPIEGRGFSTPIVLGERMFLTTATPVAPEGEFDSGEQKFIVMALDKNTGKTIWEKTATTATPHEGYHEQYGSFASNSPVSDGETLFVSFGSRGVYAYDLDGDLKWKKELSPLSMRRSFGEGTAPVVYGDYLILQHDQEADSYVLALDKRTGKELWRANRDERSAWAQPLVVEWQGRPLLVTSSTRVRTYDLETGELVWECGGLGGNAIPAVVQVNDELVIALTGWREANLLAIKLGGEGDLTGNPDYVRWTNDRGNSYTPSPVLQDGILYMLTDNGMLSALNAETGDPYYVQQRLPELQKFKASPVAADGKLYTASETGLVTVVRMGETYEVIAVNNMGDEIFVSSPIVVDGNLYLRSHDELFCIGD